MKKTRSTSHELAPSSLLHVSGGGNPEPHPWRSLEPVRELDRLAVIVPIEVRPPPLPWSPEIVIGSRRP